MCPPCLICQQPLSVEELNLNRSWHYNCEVCEICNESLPNHEVIMKALSEGRKPAHQICIQRRAVLDMKNKVLPATKDYLASVNERLNPKSWEYVHPEEGDWLKLKSLLDEIRTLGANISSLMRLNHTQIAIQQDHAYRELIEKEKKEKQEKARTEAGDQIRKTQLAAEREDPKLRQKRKAIEALMSLGVSQEDATKRIEEKLAQMAQGSTN